ncbi:MAG: hypothetical protein GF398_00345 [Chitinivibrionales bacterium]|nr:hypothetical protein [Chitinivibrionales bacterium]
MQSLGSVVFDDPRTAIDASEVLGISLYDMKGTVVKRSILENKASRFIELNIGTKASFPRQGSYAVKLTCKGKEQVRKLGHTSSP